MKRFLALLLISFFVIQLTAMSNVHAASLPFTALGQVLDRHGRPVEGATVTLYDGLYTVIGTTTSDETGNFAFTNIIANSPGIRIKVSYYDGSKTYYNDLSFHETIFYPCDWGSTDGEIIRFDAKYTTLWDYPPLEYGYIWGILQQDGTNGKALGNGVVYVATGDMKYYTITDTEKGTFVMRLPVGHYRVWGQYAQNGMIFQTPIKDIDVVGATNYMDVNNIVLTMPLQSPVANPIPVEPPTAYQHDTVAGHVYYRDGKPVPDQVVRLYQSTDDGLSGYLIKGEATTNSSGYFCFSDVQVTADAPDNGAVYGSKRFNLTVTFTDPEGNMTQDFRTFTLYNPNFITMDPDADNRTRNPVFNFTLPYSTQGWVNISSDTLDAQIYIDSKLVTKTDCQPVTMPYTAYLSPGSHMILITASGYADRQVPVSINANQQTEDVCVHLDRQQLLPQWSSIGPAVSVAIVAVAGFILGVLFTLAILSRSR